MHIAPILLEQILQMTQHGTLLFLPSSIRHWPQAQNEREFQGPWCWGMPVGRCWALVLKEWMDLDEWRWILRKCCTDSYHVAFIDLKGSRRGIIGRWDTSWEMWAGKGCRTCLGLHFCSYTSLLYAQDRDAITKINSKEKVNPIILSCLF